MRLYKPRKKYWKGKNRGKNLMLLVSSFIACYSKNVISVYLLNDGENIFLSSQNCWEKMKNLIKINFLTNI